jgi:hypothetical protein
MIGIPYELFYKAPWITDTNFHPYTYLRILNTSPHVKILSKSPRHNSLSLLSSIYNQEKTSCKFPIGHSNIPGNPQDMVLNSCVILFLRFMTPAIEGGPKA